MNSNNPLTSPLRYPGGKSFLCGYVERFLIENEIHPTLFIEPFAGGASVSLHLLGKGLVDSIAMYDKDPLISAFWKAVFEDGKWLRSRVRRTEVSLEEWNRLRSIPLDGPRTNAWKCLYMNRTSFSGILTSGAGPLGGQRQASMYGIDCRFYRTAVINRLKDLWEYRDRVADIAESDWKDTLKRIKTMPKAKQDKCFLYLDPPFFHKAERLYNYYFDTSEHENLIAELSTLNLSWLLSYDHCAEAVSLFRKYKVHHRFIPVRYTIGPNRERYLKKELVASNLRLPKGVRK